MKKKIKTKTVAKKVAQKPAKVETTAVQEALQVTWLLKGKLKSAQLYYLKIGELLVQVREKKLYAELKHKDMEDYAWKRLQLRPATMYQYLQVYDWVKEFHPAWLKPKPKGFIPDLNDVSDLMWIEKTLTDKNLSRNARAELEAMRDAALQGTLRGSELDEWKSRGGRGTDAVRSFLSEARSLRRKALKHGKIPADAIAHIDAAIQIVNGLAASEEPK